MALCGMKKWANCPGTNRDSRPTNTEVSKELQAKMAAMNAERAKQDQMWNVPETSSSNTSDPKASKCTSSSR